MTRQLTRVVPMAVVVLLLSLIAGYETGLVAQDAEPKEEKVERAEPRGRLPNYFTKVVTEEQREKIYSIQADYAAQIEPLEDQITQLEAQRDAEVIAVLTPEQLAQVKKFTEEAKRLREIRSKAKSAGN